MPDIIIEPYEPERDKDAVVRIWREVGWIDSDSGAVGLEHLLTGSACIVTRIDGEAECAVVTTPGVIRYQDTDVPLSIVSGVTTSLVGRKLGLASKLTARAVATSAEAGAAVSILGMFEQGFYDQFGFGSGSYEHHLWFDPASIEVDAPYRPPVRLTVDDWEDIHAVMAQRMRYHGGTAADPPGFTRGDLTFTEKPFGLGYRQDDGTLTHFVWGRSKGENGPYRVTLLGYRTTGQLLELLKLLSVLGDQVRSVGITQPSGIQLQDLIRHVVRQEIVTAKSEHAFRHASGAWWQLRILDLPTVAAARRYEGPPVRFVADLSDPIEAHLDSGWKGIGGRYVLTIGEDSSAVPGDDGALPVLTASINAFSRMWFGVRRASALAVTDELSGPASLLADLDRALALPEPHPDMFF
jgi:predicted acetyltransferase